MVTAETRTHLIGLSVVMLGEAPGTARLNEWVEASDGGMSLEDIANHIAASGAFTAIYPTFLTNAEFAGAMLGNLMDGENVPAALMASAVDIVTGLLNDGLSRGALALAAFQALYEIHDQGMDHPAYGDLGAVANAVAHKVQVAEHHTLTARMADPSADALEGVGSDPDSAAMAIDAIDNPPASPEETPTGEDYALAKTRDNIMGTDYDDNFLADADEDDFATLNGLDTIDGGGGHDILSVYDISTDPDMGEAEYDAQVSNIERLEIFARGGISANLSGWEGLQHVELEQFSRSGNVSVTVDGAAVSTDRTYGGDVTIVGAMGEVSVTAGKTSTVKVGSGEHTASVMAKGGATVDVNLNGAGGQSMTVASVSIDGVQTEGLGGDGKRGTPMEAVGVTVSATNGTDTASATQTQYGTNNNGTFAPIPDGAANPTTKYYKAANQDINGDADGTGLGLGQMLVTTMAADAEMRKQVFVDGDRVDPGTEGAVNGDDSGAVPVHINSDALESIELHNTSATVAVINKAKDADDLTVTVNKYGTAAIGGKLCLTDGSEDHRSSPQNVSINVVGDSNFILAGNATKTVDINLGANLTLGATTFANPNPSTPSGTLESVMFSGGGKLTMDVAGTAKLKTIDGSAGSGGSSIKGVHDAVAEVHGGSGADAVTAAGFHKDGLTVDLGAGNDVFTSAGGNSKSRIDGGEGTDVLHLTGNSATYKADGNDVSIFSNFEALEIGGSGAAGHDVGLLGVGAVSARASTTGTVTLNNMADGMGIDVIGKAGSAMLGTHAMIAHAMKAREAGDPRYSGGLDISLTASGGARDSKAGVTGTAKLTLTADGEIEILNVASSANVGGSDASVSARNKPSAANYKNELVVMGADDTADTPNAIASAVEAIVVSGSAAAVVKLMNSAGAGDDAGVAQFAELELIAAEENAGGVTFSAMIDVGGTLTGLAQALEMSGGSGNDVFTGGAGVNKLMGNGGADKLTGGGVNDVITGGAGGDTLTGGAGDDVFKYGSASESQMSGFDTITDFGTGSNTISLGRTVFNGLHRGDEIREVAAAAGINSRDDNDADGALKDSLKDWLGDGKNVFKSSDGAGLATNTTQHAITTVTELYWEDTDDDDVYTSGTDTDLSRTWVLIDVDADGDFDAATDMVIALTGTVDLTDDGSQFTI